MLHAWHGLGVALGSAQESHLPSPYSSVVVTIAAPLALNYFTSWVDSRLDSYREGGHQTIQHIPCSLCDDSSAKSAIVNRPTQVAKTLSRRKIDDGSHRSMFPRLQITAQLNSIIHDLNTILNDDILIDGSFQQSFICREHSIENIVDNRRTAEPVKVIHIVNVLDMFIDDDFRIHRLC
jgi:hypothetical protein